MTLRKLTPVTPPFGGADGASAHCSCPVEGRQGVGRLASGLRSRRHVARTATGVKMDATLVPTRPTQAVAALRDARGRTPGRGGRRRRRSCARTGGAIAARRGRGRFRGRPAPWHEWGRRPQWPATEAGGGWRGANESSAARRSRRAPAADGSPRERVRPRRSLVRRPQQPAAGSATPHPNSASESTNRTKSACREMDCFW